MALRKTQLVISISYVAFFEMSASIIEDRQVDVSIRTNVIITFITIYENAQNFGLSIQFNVPTWIYDKEFKSQARKWIISIIIIIFLENSLIWPIFRVMNSWTNYWRCNNVTHTETWCHQQFNNN